jgi:hypothetical protein
MKNLKDRSDFWKKCDVNNLAGHFHKYNSISQFERLGQLYLNKDDLDALFPKGKEIYSFDINLGLDDDLSNIDAFTFRPFISVKYTATGKAVERMFQYATHANVDPAFSTPVPLAFKDWLCNNWMALDVSLIDDVFAASFDDIVDIRQPGLPTQRINKRLLAYHFNEKFNTAFWDFVRDHRGSLDLFVFYLGIDLNKLPHKDMFTFSPIFEMRINNATEKEIYKLRKAGLRCVPLSAKAESVYYEYSSPCPSSC